MPTLVRRSSPLPPLVNRPALPAAGFSITYAREHLEEIGFGVAERPENLSIVEDGRFLPEMPPELDNSTPGELVRLMGEYTQVSCWLEELVAVADSDAVEAEVVLSNIEATIHLARGGTVADKKAKVATDPAFVSAQTDVLKRQAVLRLLKAKRSGADKCISALSRALSAKDTQARNNL